MLSTDQNAINSGPPKRFLKKGEGLKRFAAYKPPLPTTAKKSERRQTFVRFRLDQKNLEIRREPKYFVPDILNDDSINLSTEIPKIAPPKIIHTPIKPNRHALGTITGENSIFTDPQIDQNIDQLFKKIEEKKTTLEGRENRDRVPYTSSYKFRYENDGNFDERQSTPCPDDKQQQSNKLVQVSANEAIADGLIYNLAETKCRSHPKRSGFTNSLPTPAKNPNILALGKHIQQIESTVNELRAKLKKCECGVTTSEPTQTLRTRPTTRAAARAAKSKKSDTKESDRPSALADNNSIIEKLILNLADDVAQLKLKFEEEAQRKKD